jgi:Ca2+-binding RTX toxin-like protein
MSNIVGTDGADTLVGTTGADVMDGGLGKTASKAAMATMS